MKRCVAVQHVAFEHLGVFEQPLKEAGYDVTYVQSTDIYGKLSSTFIIYGSFIYSIY